jgi:hypothetical protein
MARYDSFNPSGGSRTSWDRRRRARDQGGEGPNDVELGRKALGVDDVQSAFTDLVDRIRRAGVSDDKLEAVYQAIEALMSAVSKHEMAKGGEGEDDLEPDMNDWPPRIALGQTNEMAAANDGRIGLDRRFVGAFDARAQARADRNASNELTKLLAAAPIPRLV